MRFGFTLIEFLLVIAIISILSVGVLFAINPQKRIADSQNARREADIDTILVAVHSSFTDFSGSLPTNIANIPVGQERMLTNSTTANFDCLSGNITSGGCNVPDVSPTNICVNPLIGSQNLSAYIPSIPVDPLGGPSWTTDRTGYAISYDSNYLITVKACGGPAAPGNLYVTR